MKTTFIFLISVLMLANTAHAANWQTPEQAMQLAAETDAAAPQPTRVNVQPRFFQVTSDDIGAAVATQMQKQGFNQSVNATLTPMQNKVIYSADHPLKLAIQALQIDTDAKLWQAQAYILSGNKTETVKPIAGRYEVTQRVPVLTRQLHKGDVVAEGDIAFKTISGRQLRKDTITDAAALVGQSPDRIISADRPIRTSEISAPLLIKKGQSVALHYTTPYMSIRTTGEALEDGAMGTLIRVKNSNSDKAISGHVTAAGNVEVNSES